MKSKIIVKSQVVVESNLPLPFVYYPDHYGTFIGYKNSLDTQLYFCSCQYDSIQNFISMRLDSNLYRESPYVDDSQNYLINSNDFPRDFCELLIVNKINEDKTIIDAIPFKDKICHRCNKQTPSVRHCHEMYGGVFKQKYGWYINVKYYENAIYFNKYDERKTPLDIQRILKSKLSDNINMFREYEELDSFSDKKLFNYLNKLDNQIQSDSRDSMYEYSYVISRNYRFQDIVNKVDSKIRRRMHRFVENQTRLDFNTNLIGEKWTSETILFNIVSSIYPNLEIIRHWRPRILNFLELDIYIPKLKLGIEYQGIQHYKPVKHWGGDDALVKRKENDKIKNNLCLQNDIYLIYFDYNEELSFDFVKSRINSTLI